MTAEADDDVATTRARIVAEVCDRIRTGESVNEIFTTPNADWPCERTFWRWLDADSELDRVYERATARRGEKYAEEVVGIVDAAGSPLLDDEGRPFMRDGKPIMVVDRCAIEHAKLRADKRQWAAARMLPKRYGDKVTLAGDADNPIALVDHTAIASKLLPELAARGSPTASGDPDET